MTITAAHRPPDRLQADGRGTSDTNVHADDAMRAIGDDTHAQGGSGDADGELRRSDATFATITANDGAELTLIAVPIMPHGGFVLWGG